MAPDATVSWVVLVSSVRPLLGKQCTAIILKDSTESNAVDLERHEALTGITFIVDSLARDTQFHCSPALRAVPGSAPTPWTPPSWRVTDEARADRHRANRSRKRVHQLSLANAITPHVVNRRSIWSVPNKEVRFLSASRPTPLREARRGRSRAERNRRSAGHGSLVRCDREIAADDVVWAEARDEGADPPMCYTFTPPASS